MKHITILHQSQIVLTSTPFIHVTTTTLMHDVFMYSSPAYVTGDPPRYTSFYLLRERRNDKSRVPNILPREVSSKIMELRIPHNHIYSRVYIYIHVFTKRKEREILVVPCLRLLPINCLQLAKTAAPIVNSHFFSHSFVLDHYLFPRRKKPPSVIFLTILYFLHCIICWKATIYLNCVQFLFI